MTMLVIKVSEIPPEGIALDAGLDVASLHLEGEGAFRLEGGGRVAGHVDKGDDASVHLRGRLAAGLGVECARCLVPFGHPVAQELDLFFLPQGAEAGAEDEEEVQLSDHDVVVAYYRDDRLDLGEALREQLLLALPLKPLCREDCRGLCPACGANRNQMDCGCAAETATLDPRWAALAKLPGGGTS
jgi:uncharacterized protein